MRIKIRPDGIAINEANQRRLGNVISQPLSQFGSDNNIQLEIELPNTHCNIGGTDPTTGQRACLVCPRNLEKFQPDSDRVEEICEVIKAQLHQVGTLWIGGDAEPFWQDRIFELLNALDLHFADSPRVITTTNGTLLDKDRAVRWLESVGKSQISFSVDATCPDTYFRLRRVAEYERVVRNLDHYCRTRDPDRHIAVLRNNINLLNIDEVENMVQMTRDHFLHYLTLSPSRAYKKSLRQICLNKGNQARFLEAGDKARSLAESLGVNLVFSDDWPTGK